MTRRGLAWVLLTALTAVTAACGPVWNSGSDEDPTEIALRVYAAKHGAPSAHCADRARGLVVDVMTPDEVTQVCHKHAAGCLDEYDVDSQHAVMADDVGSWVVAHETLHVLLRCQHVADDGDPAHRDTVWAERLDE